jgi:hypothetical protein
MKAMKRSARSDRNRKAIAGVRKQFASTKTVVLDGVSYAPDDIVKALQGSIDAADATTAVTAQFHKTVDAERAANATADAVYAGLKTYVTSQYKASPDTLAEFGINLPSRQVPDAATAAAAVEKRQATRVARHTMGNRQKANVKGTVTTPTAAPPPTPITPPAK